MNNLFFGWLLLASTFIVIEVGHPGLFLFLSFGLGAIAAAVSGLCYALPEQIIVFICTSLLCCWIFWQKAKKSQRALKATNMYALRGSIGTVITAIPARGVGQVKVNNEQWSARYGEGHAVAVGASVMVLEVQGCHLIVKPHTV